MMDRRNLESPQALHWKTSLVGLLLAVFLTACGGGGTGSSSSSSDVGAGGLGPLVNTGGGVGDGENPFVHPGGLGKCDTSAGQNAERLTLTVAVDNAVTSGDANDPENPLQIPIGVAAGGEGGNPAVHLRFYTTSALKNEGTLNPVTGSLNFYDAAELDNPAAGALDNFIPVVIGPPPAMLPMFPYLAPNTAPFAKGDLVYSHEAAQDPTGSYFDDPVLVGYTLAVQICDSLIQTQKHGSFTESTYSSNMIYIEFVN